MLRTWHRRWSSTRGRGIGPSARGITADWKASAFEQLERQKGAIEAELEHSLEWMPLPEKKSARILLEEKIDPKDEENRDDVKRWFAEKSVTMYRAFRDRVLALELPT